MTATPVSDVPARWPTLSTARRFQGRVFSVRTDRVVMPDGEAADRDVVEHPGAVAVLALDDAERVLLIRQYRHPVGRLLWELPAGLRDVDGEQPLATAQRELMEEAAFRATSWLTLVDFLTTPGMSDERVRIFLARGLSEIPDAERDFTARHEEARLEVAWLPLDDAVNAVVAGRLHNPTAVVGILASYAARSDRFATLRSVDAPEG